MKLLLVLLSFVCVMVRPAAQAQWVQTQGPCGGAASAFAYVPIGSTGAYLFAGTNAGVFRSSNHGTFWDAVNEGWVTTRIQALAVSGTRLFAGTSREGVLLSTNNGGTWVAVNTGLADHRILALVVSGSSLFAGTTEGGVFRSTNNGASWAAANAGLDLLRVSALAVSGPNLFCGTQDGPFRSTNNGLSWTPANAGLTGTEINAFTVRGGSIFAATWDRGIFRSTDDGASWAGIGPASVAVQCLLVSGDFLFAGSNDEGIFLSTNEGTTWTSVNMGLTDLCILSLVAGDTKLFAGTSDGVFRSTDGGTTWARASDGMMIYTSVSSLYARGTTLLAGTGGSGVFRSTDEGTHWGAGHTSFTSGGKSIANHDGFAVIGTTMFAGTRENVFRSTDDGVSWTATGLGSGVEALATKDTMLIAARGDEQGGVLLSTDYGTSWVQTGIGGYYCEFTALAVSGSMVFAGSVSHYFCYPGGVQRSSDNGITWIGVDDGLTNREVLCLAVSGTDLFAGTRGGGVFRTTNCGTTWTAASVGLGNLVVQTLISEGTNLFAGTGDFVSAGGVYLSTNNGGTWTAVDAGLPYRQVRSLAVGGATLFAGTVGGGVWRRPLREFGQLVDNPGFESGTDPWHFFTNGTGTFSNSAPGFESNHAGVVSITTQGTNVQLYQSGIALESNGLYRLRFRAYSNTGHDLSVSLHKHTAPYTPYGLAERFINLTNSWQEYEIEFVTSGFTGTVDDARLRFWLAPYDINGDRYYFDDVVLWKVNGPQPPSITLEPEDQSLSEGEAATFVVEAIGTAPLSYRWQRDGVAIPGPGGAGKSYMTAPLTMADNGATFQCVISNPYGTVTSRAALLTVSPSVLNAVNNPGFESGKAPWAFYTNGAGAFNSVTPGYDGTKCGKVNITSIGSNMQLYQAGITLNPSTTYMLSFAAYSNRGHKLTVSVHRNDAPYTGYGLSNRVVSLGNSWQMHSFIFTTSGFSGTATNARLRFSFNGYASAGDVYYIDNVVLVPTTTKGTPVENPVPAEFALHQNYPNPFNPLTVINYQSPIETHVTLKIYDVLGREVITLVDEVQEAGYKAVEWDATGSASGVYFYRLQAGEFVNVKKMVVSK